jgi:hypothetical protein
LERVVIDDQQVSLVSLALPRVPSGVVAVDWCEYGGTISLGGEEHLVPTTIDPLLNCFEVSRS